MDIHKNAPLTPRGREHMVNMVLGGQTPEAVAEAVGVCPRTVRKWLRRFREEGLAGLHQVMQEGVPVLGYYHWSLLDNYEWIFGYRPKFGLATLDRQTFERRAKPSARVLARIARSNAL